MRKNKHSLGYILVFVPDHPFCDHHGFVPEHRLKVERKFNKIFSPLIFHVHHKNGIKNDNRITNLEVLTKQEHVRIHAGWIKKNGKWWKNCPTCKNEFEVNTENFYKRKMSGTSEFVSDCKKCCFNKNRTPKRLAYFKKKTEERRLRNLNARRRMKK